MAKQELTNTRDLTMNNFRRKELFNKCYMTDIDALEYRYIDNKIKFVAIIDYKQWHVKDIDQSSIRAQYELSKQLNIPFYIVWYRIEDDELEVKLWNVTENPNFDKYFLHIRHYDEKKFIKFINEL